MKNIFKKIALFGVCLSLVSCSDKEKEIVTTPPPACPFTGILEDASRMEGTDMAVGPYKVTLDQYDGVCTYKENGDVIVDVDLFMSLTSDYYPSEGVSLSVPYFVTILGPDREVIVRKQLFSVFKVPAQSNKASAKEPLRLRVPVPKAQLHTADQYKVVAGLQVSRDQFERNYWQREQRYQTPQ